eukprot:6201204-Pleurochrysis_carterae.AAC.3
MPNLGQARSCTDAEIASFALCDDSDETCYAELVVLKTTSLSMRIVFLITVPRPCHASLQASFSPFSPNPSTCRVCN